MRLRALIFDDEPLIRRLLWSICDRRGYEVFTFPDPGICPLQRETTCPCLEHMTCSDIIVSDLEMPLVNGLDFIESLLGKGCRCHHIALISGTWCDQDLARAEKLGCAFFEKPFRIEEFIAWLARVERSIAPGRQLLEGISFGLPSHAAKAS